MFDESIRDGVVADQAELARPGRASRARVSQIMNLLNLAPDIQEAILFLPRVEADREPVTQREVRPIAEEVSWGRQHTPNHPKFRNKWIHPGFVPGTQLRFVPRTARRTTMRSG